jgi:hypothetical protein
VEDFANSKFELGGGGWTTLPIRVSSDGRQYGGMPLLETGGVGRHVT